MPRRPPSPSAAEEAAGVVDVEPVDLLLAEAQLAQAREELVLGEQPAARVAPSSTRGTACQALAG